MIHTTHRAPYSYTQPPRRKRRRIRKRAIFLRFLLLIFLITVLVHFPGFISNIYNTLIGAASKATVAALPADEYPESLRELLKNNPETRGFVLHYPDRTPVSDIDISDEVTKGTIPLFIQWDERWGYETYGDDMLALTGCGPTCLSMVYCGLTGDTSKNPYAMACWAQQEGYYQSGAGSAWLMMSEGAEKLGLDVSELSLDADHIRSTLEAGHPIICVMGPGDFTTSGHFIVLTSANRDGTIRINDPNSRKRSDKDWDLDTIMKQTRNLWSYQSSK